MELISIDTLDEFELDGDPSMLVVLRCDKAALPSDVFECARLSLELWGEEVTATRIYSLERDEGCILVGVRCEV